MKNSFQKFTVFLVYAVILSCGFVFVISDSPESERILGLIGAWQIGSLSATFSRWLSNKVQTKSEVNQ